MDEKTFKTLEDFALSRDRSETLAALHPGTELHSYLKILDHIQTVGSQAPEELSSLIEAHQKRWHYGKYHGELELCRQLLLYDSASQEQQKEVLRQINETHLHYNFEHPRPSYASHVQAPSAKAKSSASDPQLSISSVLPAEKLSLKSLFSDALADTAAISKLSVRGLLELDLDRLSPDCIKVVFSRVPMHELDPHKFISAVKKYVKKDKWTTYANLCNPRDLTVAQLELLFSVGDAKEDYSVVQPWLAKKFGCQEEMKMSEQVKHCKAIIKGLSAIGSTSTSVTIKVTLLYHILQLLLRLNGKGEKVFKEFLNVPRSANYLKDHSGFLSMFKKFGQIDSSFIANLGMDTSFYVQEMKLVEIYLFKFLKDQPDSKSWDSYFNPAFIAGMFAKIKLMAGDPDPRWSAIYAEKRNASTYENFMKEKWLKFALHCPPLFTPGDPVTLALDIKGVESLVLRTFEINVNNYYRTTWNSLSSDLNLDGIIPNIEETFTFALPAPKVMTFTYSSKFISEKTRGVFVIEAIGGGLSSRALIRKGQLKCATRLTTSGHSICILNESNEVCKGPSTGILLSTRFFPTDDQGLVTIPFSASPRTTKIIVQHEGYSELCDFQLQGEEYQLKAGFVCPAESLVVGSACKVLIRPFLTVNGIECPVEVLKDAKAVIVLEDFDKVVRTKTFPLGVLSRSQESVVEFQVPPKLHLLRLSLHASVTPATASAPTVLATKPYSLPVNSTIPSKAFTELYLRGVVVDGYRLYYLQALGRTGEGQAGVSISVRLSHKFTGSPLPEVVLVTNENGEVELGRLEGVTAIDARGYIAGETSHSVFHLEEQPMVFPKNQHCLAGRVAFPYLLSTVPAAKSSEKKLTEMMRDEVTLVRLDNAQTAIDNLTNALEFQTDDDSTRSGTIVADLQPGKYSLFYKAYNAATEVSVSKGEVWNDAFIISPTSIIDMRGADPVVRISSIKLENNRCQVQVRGQDPTCRVHILAYHFWESSDPALIDRLLPTKRSMPLPISVPKVASMYLNERKLGEEYSYVLERRTQERFLGCTLEKPQVLLKRLYIKDTKTDVQDAKEGTAYARKELSAARASAQQRVDKKKKARVSASPFHDFLQVPATLFPNLPVSSDGFAEAEIDFSQFSHIVAVAVQGNTMAKRVRALPLLPVPKRDLTCASSLDPQRHYCQTLVATAVRDFDTYLIEDIASVEMQVVDSAQKVAQALKALGAQWVSEWEFLFTWNRLTHSEKNEKYWQFASHEMNFFLMKKDPEYFQSVVKPFLVHKLEKDIVDHYLLNTPGYDWPQHATLVGEAYTGLKSLNPFEQSLVLSKLRETHPELCAAAAERMKWQAKAAEFQPQQWMRAFETVLQLETEKPEPPRAMASPPAVPMAPREPPLYKVTSTKELEATKEYAETTYYGLKLGSPLTAVRPSPFWADLFAHVCTPSPAFLSSNFLYEVTSTGGLLALALLDLPINSTEHGFRTGQGREVTLKAASNLLVFRKQVKEAQFDQQRSVLVAQRFFNPAEQFTFNEKGQKVEKPVAEFLRRRVYGCQVILTNVSSVQQTFNVMWQLPNGALPVSSMDYSKNVSETVSPFSTKSREFLFYFPFAGRFQMMPSQVAKNAVVVGAFHAVEVEVKETPTIRDPTSLENVLSDGSTEAILNFIETQNIFDTQRTKFSFADILYLLKDKTFFLQLVSLLRNKRIFEESVWKFSLLHNDPSAVKELFHFKVQTFTAVLGPWFESGLLTVRPTDWQYRHLEYAPLANARIYRLGQDKKIMNSALKTQYERFVMVLAKTPAPLLTERELIPLVYYLLLQDRVALALEFFRKVEVKELTLQYDYLAAYFEFLQGSEGFEESRRVIEKYRNYPVLTWHRYFAEVRRQVEEIDGQRSAATDSRESRQDVLASSEPSLTARLDVDELFLTCRNLRTVKVNYYVLDLEVYFSLNPFAGTDKTGFSFVKPTVEETIQVEGAVVKHRIPEELRHKAVHIEVRAGGLSQSLSYFNNSKLRVHAFEHKGHLRVTDPSGKGVPQVYVKAFATLHSGSVDFYKDGYTDLRGVFDYVSLNTRSISAVRKLAVMVIDDALGGIVREVAPPTV